MNELIRVQHNEDGNIIVSGRELHEFLEIKTPYTQWFSDMLKYEFEEDVDFTAINELSEKNEGSRIVKREVINHVLVIDMAKELAMIQRNNKGKQARRYFIEVEKKHKQGIQQAIEQPTSNTELSIADRIKMMELISNAPEHAIEYVAGIAKPFMSEEKPQPVQTKALPPVKEPETIKKKMASSAGHTVPFNVKRLRNYLVRNNISQSELVSMSGVPSGVISAAITGRSKPGLESRGKICVALGKSVDWLNGGAQL